MKILAIDTESNALDWLMRCQAWGHEVQWFDRVRKNGVPRCAGEGIVPKLRDIDELRKKWIGWADLIILTDNNYMVQFLETYRKLGYPIVAASPEAASWEIDRMRGQQVIKDAGIPILDSKIFRDYGAAAAHVKKHPHMLVSKPCGSDDKALSYVAHDPGDMLYMLEDRWAEREDLVAAAKANGFLLQEKIDGIEMAVGGWFGPGGWSKHIWENFEFKKLFSGDLGPNTGEMGTLGRYVSKSKLADLALYPLTKQLERIGYVGYVDNNVMVKPDGSIGPMELTMRFGWPNFNNQCAVHRGDPAKWLADLLDGKDTLTVSNDVCVSVVMAIPDFPYSKATQKEVCGIPIYGATDFEHVHWCEVMVGENVPVFVDGKVVRMPHPVTAGDYLMVITGTGSTITGARKSAYSAIRKIDIPNSPFYRMDIGKGRLVHQLPQLHKLGFATGLDF